MQHSRFKDRLFRCGDTDVRGDEILLCNRNHTSQRLRAIADAGFNGIFLPGTLRKLAPGRLFRKYSRKPDERLAALATLCRRAQRFGLGVWVYFLEPLGLPQSHPFWRDHPGLRGHPTQIYDYPPDFALCSSTDEVREYLHDGARDLFRRAPLAGAMLLTASEVTNNCWAHIHVNSKGRQWAETFWDDTCDCPRCGPRGPLAVVAEIIETLRRGVRAGRPAARVVAWDWSWNMYLPPPYAGLVNRLAEDVVLMGDFERGGVVKRAGKRLAIEEYSLIYPGPSNRFRGEVRANAGRRDVWAKLQVNCTHEIASVPNVPMVVSLYRKFSYMQQAAVSGYLATWSTGCHTDTLNIFAVNKLSTDRLNGGERRWLAGLAREYFGPDVDAEGVVGAWQGFHRACSFYPIGGDNQFIYFGPINDALGHPLKLRFDGTPMGPGWMKHKIGDRLEDTATSYTLAEIAELLGKLAGRWGSAVQQYRNALAPLEHRARARKELGVAEVAGALFRSAANIYRWYLLRRKKTAPKLTVPERRVVADELANVQAALPWVQADRRIGYHYEAECYMFTPASMKRKIRELKSMLA